MGRYREFPARRVSLDHRPMKRGDVVVRWRDEGGDNRGYIIEANFGGVIIEGAGHYSTDLESARESAKRLLAVYGQAGERVLPVASAGTLREIRSELIAVASRLARGVRLASPIAADRPKRPSGRRVAGDFETASAWLKDEAVKLRRIHDRLARLEAVDE